MKVASTVLKGSWGTLTRLLTQSAMNSFDPVIYMKLSFHGASYEYHPSEIKVTEEEVGGRYRGLPWKVHRSKQQYNSDLVP